jgi:hypothetical protein
VYIVIHQLWGISGVVGGSLLLLGLPLLLILLRVHSPCSQLELIPVLAKGVVKGSQVLESSPSSNKLYHLPSFGDFNGLDFVLVVGCGEWGMYDFF